MTDVPVMVHDGDGYRITPAVVLEAYRHGLFPMAEERDAHFHWYRPATRAIITWDRYTVPRSLEKVARNRRPYELTIDRAFPQVVAACAEARTETWICRDIETLYVELHRQGHAHSVEAWRDGELVGGLYGLVVGGCFCGESMFHRAPDASKLCVMHLVEHLKAAGFTLLDCQQQTPHMERFGAYEVDSNAYRELLAQALQLPVRF